jgi:hypothetical protein
MRLPLSTTRAVSKSNRSLREAHCDPFALRVLECVRFAPLLKAHDFFPPPRLPRASAPMRHLDAWPFCIARLNIDAKP